MKSAFQCSEEVAGGAADLFCTGVPQDLLVNIGGRISLNGLRCHLQAGHKLLSRGSRILCFLWEVSDEMLGLLEERVRPDVECVYSARAKHL